MIRKIRKRRRRRRAHSSSVGGQGVGGRGVAIARGRAARPMIKTIKKIRKTMTGKVERVIRTRTRRRRRAKRRNLPSKLVFPVLAEPKVVVVVVGVETKSRKHSLRPALAQASVKLVSSTFFSIAGVARMRQIRLSSLAQGGDVQTCVSSLCIALRSHVRPLTHTP